MVALKDAYERKANFEEMGYLPPPKKLITLIRLMKYSDKVAKCPQKKI